MDENILFIISGLKRGGIETYLLRFLENYKGRFNAYVLCRNNEKDEELYNKYLALGVTINVIPRKYFSPLSVYDHYRFIKKGNFSAVCDFSGDFGGFTLFIAMMSKVRNRIAFYRESEYQFKMTLSKRIFLLIIRKLLSLSATKMLSNSKEAFNNFQPNWKNNPAKFMVIYNGIITNAVSIENVIFLKQNLSIPENAFVIGHVGRYTPAKNYNTIIEIAKYFRNKHSNVYFVLFGRDVGKGLNDSINAFGLQNTVICPGQIDNVFEAHQLMDVFLFPSLNEGQPNAMLEAMFTGIPIIASDIPSHRDCFPKEMVSFLIPPNDINGFNEAIEQLMQLKNGYPVEKLKLWAYKIFNAERRFNDFYNELVN